MKKYALIVHGWPQTVTKSHPLIPILKQKGYEIIAPNMFELKKIDFDTTISLLKKSIKSKNVKVMVGISMGGLLLPHLLQDKSDCKGVFIASSIKFYPDMNLTRWLIKYKLINYIPDPSLFFKIIPKSILNLIWSVISPFKGNSVEKKEYETDRDTNFSVMAKLSKNKCQQIFDLVVSIDNSQLIKKLKNPILFVSGRNDSLMPYQHIADIQSELKNSRLFLTNNTGHFGVLNRESLQKISEFI